MNLRRSILSSIVLLFISLLILDAVNNKATSYSDVFLANYNCTNSPLDGKSCNFTGCHAGPAPIAVSGLITSTIPGAGYTPGVTYSLTTSVTRPGHTHFGFSISPQNASGTLGTLIATDAVRTYVYPGSAYITHRRNGVDNTNTATWSFNWTAPAAGSGTVTFYGSLLAGDMSGAVYTVTGDTTFVSTLIVPENVCNIPGLPDAINGNINVCRNTSETYFVNPVSGATSYVWTLPSGWSGSSSSNSITVTTGTGSGTIAVYASNSCGDGQPATLSVNIDPLLNTSVSSTDVLCSGGNDGSASVTASGGASPYSYAWQPSGGSSAVATQLAVGTYTVVVTDNIGCTTSASVTVNQPVPVTVSTASTPATCGLANGTVTANPSGGVGSFQYSWLPGGGTTATVTGLSSGAYTVIVTDANSCTATATENVTQPSTLSVQANSVIQITCFGMNNGEIHLSTTGGITPYSYSWNPNISTTEDAAGLAPGDYFVTVTDNSGCSFVDVYTITQPAQLAGSISVLDAACQGQATGGLFVGVSGGTLPYTYSWSTSPVQTNDTASGLAAGTYTVTITDDHNCTSTASGTVQAPAAMVAQTVVDSVDCHGSTLNSSASVIVTGGSPGYSYLWSNNNTTSGISNVLAGNYSVTITDQNGCTLSQSLTIAEPDLLTLTPTPTDVTCYGGNNGSAQVNVTGGTPPYTYSWQADTSEHSNTLNGISTGNYLVVVNDIHSCFDTKLIQVNQPQELIASAGNSVSYCTQGSALLGGTPAATGGVNPYTYLWLPQDSLDNPTASNPLATPAITTVYTLTVTDGNSCLANSSVLVTVYHPDPVFITEGPSVLWTIPGYDSYQWYRNDTLINGATGSTFPNPQDGIYSIDVVDSNGCVIHSSDYNYMLGIEKTDQENQIHLFPNPAGNTLTLLLPQDFSGGILYIRNSGGETVMQRDGVSGLSELDLSHYDQGIYFLSVQKGRSIRHYRFTVLR